MVLMCGRSRQAREIANSPTPPLNTRKSLKPPALFPLVCLSVWLSRKRTLLPRVKTMPIVPRRALAGAHLLETQSRPFFAWDLLTVAQLVHPELFTTSEVECDVVVAGASQGRVVRAAAGGRGGC